MKNTAYLTVTMIIASLFLLPKQTQAAWDVTAKVVNIEPSYMPDMILFKLDTSSSSCAAGNWVFYYGDAYNPTDPKENNKAIYAGLLAALNSGKKVEVHGDTGCIAINIHSTEQ